MIKHFDTIAIYVDDQERSLEFWTKQIGFEERRRISMGNGFSWMEVAPRGAQSGFVLYPRALMTNWTELKPSVVFRCDDIDATCAELKSKGVRFAKELAQLPWGKFASFLDPDDNEFGLRGPWDS